MSNSEPRAPALSRWARLVTSMLLAAGLSLASAAPVLAAPTLGKPSYGGPGCPEGTATVGISRDGKSVTMKFSRYQVAAGGGTGKTFDRKACGISIPMLVPSGQSVSLVDVTFKGSNKLPSGAKSTFSFEIFFAGGQGPVISRTVNGPQSGSFTVGATGTANVWSPCGTDPILRTQSSIRVTTSGGRAASASVRSQEVSSALVFRFKFRSC